MRKAYSTIPDNHYEALHYLLKSNYRIEAHLKSQYAASHGELVLGKALINIIRKQEHFTSPNFEAINLIFHLDPPPEEGVRKFIREEMSKDYSNIDENFVDLLLNPNDGVFHGTKQRTVVFASAGENLVGFCLIISKRGGAVKLAPFVCVNNRQVASMLLGKALDFAKSNLLVRKFYSFFPLSNSNVALAFQDLGFLPEGLLTDPYRDDVHMLAYSKFIGMKEQYES